MDASALTQSQVEVLATAVLSVGGWPVERVQSTLAALREAEVLSPAAVAGMDLGILTVKLAKNGYNRGLLTSMYAERLQAVMKAVHAGELSRLAEYVGAGDRGEFEKLFREVHGVGPRVASRAWDLLLAHVP